MTPTIFNLGSLNIDRVFRVPHIVVEGETLASTSLDSLAGGKGANQSVALARAGAKVAHIGRVGVDGRWLVELLAAEGVDTRWIRTCDVPTGQAIIQVDDQGQNAIVLDGGANRTITKDEIDEALATARAGDWLLAQNETSEVDHAMRRARELGLRVALNPAPVDARIRGSDWHLADLLCVNEIEAAALVGGQSADVMLKALSRRAPACEVVLTLGDRGAMAHSPQGNLQSKADRVTAIDTTAAGDTFLGYYLATRSQGHAMAISMTVAQMAAAKCVTRAGAIASIPRRSELPLDA